MLNKKPNTNASLAASSNAGSRKAPPVSPRVKAPAKSEMGSRTSPPKRVRAKH